MTQKIIAIADHRNPNRALVIPGQLETPNGALLDTRSRPLQDLRISLTDRCNFRCIYCMPKEIFGPDYVYQPHNSLLTFEEITRIARIFVAHGVEKIRLSGGEPLLRKGIEKLVAMLRNLTTPDGRALDLTLTTNGSLLARKAQALKDAGLNRITVSLDALDDATFRRMNDADFSVRDVLHGIDVAHQVGLGPVKVNMVVKGGVNDQEIIPMARYFKDTPAILRFIEYMDVGSSNGWKMDDVIASADVVATIDRVMPLVEIERQYASETARHWRYRDGHGEIGVISSVTNAFCGTCSRARLSTEGKLYTCLFATSGHDLRSLVRGSASDAEMSTVLAHLWRARVDRYSELRSTTVAAAVRRVEMSYIGG